MIGEVGLEANMKSKAWWTTPKKSEELVGVALDVGRSQPCMMNADFLGNPISLDIHFPLERTFPFTVLHFS